MESEAPSAILKGLLNVSIDGVQPISDLFYVDHKFAKDKWAFEVRLDLRLESEKQVSPFLQYSRWFVVVDYDYPFGNIEILPAKVDGIKETYPHQTMNCEWPADLPWRMGKLCLDKPIRSLGLIAGHHDPIGNSEERIRWHLQRALAWIHAAATNTLVKAGDPFEIPYCPASGEIRYVHDESESSFHAWEGGRPGDWGYVIWDSLDGIDKAIFAYAYFTRNKTLLRATPKYDESFHAFGDPDFKQGLWWLWPTPVVLKPWQVPSNWEELRRVGKVMKINVDNCLNGMAKTLRGQDSTTLLIGYPIPKRYGERSSEIHWQAILLPKLLPELKAGRKPHRGFRSNERWQWWLDRTTVFTDKDPLNYLQTENWHTDRMQARGRLLQTLRDAKIALIGCGALGSIVAELLVRGGVGDMLFVDPEILVAGNLVRHTLSGQDIGEQKSVALAKRLVTAAPFAKIKVHAKRFPTQKYEVISLLENYDIVIDCTADDEVVSALSLGWWGLEKLFLSASVGYEARRTFLFTHRGQDFPLQVFQAMIEPLLQEERALWSGSGETLEGAGCWSPLFPARMDDLLLAASSTVKILEELAKKRELGTRLVTLEQVTGEGFLGLKRSDTTGNAERGE